MRDLFNTVCFACLNPSLLKYFSITSMSIIKGSAQDNREHNSSSLLRAQKQNMDGVHVRFENVLFIVFGQPAMIFQLSWLGELCLA